MISFIKRNWDIVFGIGSSLAITIATKFDDKLIRLSYSISILCLVQIGLLKLIKQSIDLKKSQKLKRKNTIVDQIVDSQTSVKAVAIANDPVKFTDKLSRKIYEIIRGGFRFMNKVKVFLDKFKGYLLAGALTVLSIVEMYGGYINEVFNGKLVINDVEVIPAVTLIASVIVSAISNGYSKEQRDKVKALFCKKPTDEIVKTEIKNRLKTNTINLKELNKVLLTQQTELDTLNIQLASAIKTHDARKEMFAMIPQLATMDDVRHALTEVNNINANIEVKKREIEVTQNNINKLNDDINLLKSQL